MNCRKRWISLGLMLALLHYSAMLSAQEATSSKDMAELFAEISDKDLTTLQKNRFIGATYAGVLEVSDVQETTSDGTMVRIVAQPAPLSTNWIMLSFSTADVQRTGGLRRWDKVRVQGKLVRIRVTPHLDPNRRAVDWLEFEQVTIGEKVTTGPK